MLRSRSVFLLLALVLSTAACAEDAGSSATTGPETDPTGATATGSTAPSDSPTASESPTVGPEAELEDGRHFGFVKTVDIEGLALEFDLAYFLTGDEANEAAEEHGEEVPVPNDYYIVNDNPRLRTLGVAPDLEILLFDWNRCCDETFPAGFEEFAQAIAAGEPLTIGDRLYYGAFSPYWLTVEGGAVTRIEEQYLP
jgi:hypothetical protein